MMGGSCRRAVFCFVCLFWFDRVVSRVLKHDK